MEDKYFKQALSDFTIEFASGDAIRSLSDKGYSVKKIKSKLDFPTPEERIREIVWKHYIDNKTICLQNPKETSLGGKYTIEKVGNEIRLIPSDGSAAIPIELDPDLNTTYELSEKR